MPAVTLLTGCSGIKEKIKDAASAVKDQVISAVEENAGKNPYQSPHDYAVDMFEQVFELVKAKDSEAIFELFSEYNKSNFDMLSDIEILVDFMDEIAEIEHIGASNNYSSVRDGKTVSASYSAAADIRAKNGTLYWFKVGVITAADDETKLGLDWIYILDCKVKTAYTTECGEWNEHRINGAKEPEPKRPDDMEVGVHYFKSQK